MPLTMLCIATYHKGDDFLDECHRQGCRVLLLTEEKLRDADWPRDAIDAFYYVRRDMPETDIRKGAAFLARTERLDRIVALDDFDVETAAMLREYLHVPGMGETTARAFRDKLAMRARARARRSRARSSCTPSTMRPSTSGPRGSPALGPEAAIAGGGHRDQEDRIRRRVVADPRRARRRAARLRAGAVRARRRVSRRLARLRRRVVFAAASRYGTPPMAVAHGGGIFVTRTLSDEDATERPSRENARVLESFGLRRGVSHTEFIRGQDGEVYFLETSARVGGAYIVDVVEAATGVNLWREWAKIEIAGEHGRYEPPSPRAGHAGIVLSLARQEEPDLSAYDAPEIVKRSETASRGVDRRVHRHVALRELVDSYVTRFYTDFHASAPPPERATD